MRPEKTVQGIPAPPAIASLWVRYMLGLGVSVVVGLAPYLGKLNVPLFTPLLSLIPDSLQTSLIPTSTALMSVVAVAIQWYGGERPSRKRLSRWFARILLLVVVSFVLLVYIGNAVVVRVQFLGTESASILVGFSRPYKAPCPEGVSDSECIRSHLTFNPAAIESFWGDRQIRIARLALTLSYLFFMCSFSSLVGVLVLRAVGSRRTGKGRSPVRDTESSGR